MGNWSPYSEEWERQRIEKFIEKADAARKEFEKVGEYVCPIPEGAVARTLAQILA